VPRIMLVDDNNDHLKLFTMILQEKGFSVETFSDSAAALLKFRPNYYDLLILDFRMPNLNGLDLYRIIRKLDPTAKAILLTASHEQLIESKKTPADDYLRVVTKPITNEEFMLEIGSSFRSITSSG
jgi:DNA-binding response OmpR family regulator